MEKLKDLWGKLNAVIKSLIIMVLIMAIFFVGIYLLMHYECITILLIGLTILFTIVYSVVKNKEEEDGYDGY